MQTFVHIAPAKLENHIRRSGLKPGKELFGYTRNKHIYAFPVLENYVHTHQWAREVLKWRRQPLVSVYFRIPDDEPVLLKHIRSDFVETTAQVANTAIRQREDPRGFEVLLPRNVSAKEITRIAPVRGVVGWRHMPDAHAHKPCGCPACVMRGEPGGRRLREAYERGE